MIAEHPLDAIYDPFHLLFVAPGRNTSGLKILLERQDAGNVQRNVHVAIFAQRQSGQT